MLPPGFVTRFISETIFSGLGTTVTTKAATAWSKLLSLNVMFSASISEEINVVELPLRLLFLGLFEHFSRDVDPYDLAAAGIER